MIKKFHKMNKVRKLRNKRKKKRNHPNILKEELTDKKIGLVVEKEENQILTTKVNKMIHILQIHQNIQQKFLINLNKIHINHMMVLIVRNIHNQL